MKRSAILFAVVMLGVLIVVARLSETQQLYAQPSGNSPDVGKIITQTLQNNLTIKRNILSDLHTANLHVLGEHKEKAEASINAALRNLEMLPDALPPKSNALASPPKDPGKAEQKVIKLEYGSALVAQSTIIPVNDAALTLHSLETDIDMNGIKRGAIHAASVKYVRYTIDKPAMRRALVDALDKTNKGHFAITQNIIQRLHDAMLKDDSSQVDLQAQARDHLILARYLIKNAEFNGARDALTKADSIAGKALNQNMPWKTVDIAKLRARIATISKQLKAQDPTVLDQMDAMLKEWWSDI